MADGESPQKTLTTVSLSEVCQNEYIALEMIEGGGYDTKRHPLMARRRPPVYQRKDDGWELLSSYGDVLFETVGAAKRHAAICAHLNTLSRTRFADLDIAAYNATAGDEALVLGVDYGADDACTLPKTLIGDRTYYVVDGCTYMLSVATLDRNARVQVVSFDGMRVPDIEREEQRKYNEMLSKQKHRISIDSELGRFIVGVLARDMIVVRYDIETGVYAPKHASTPRLVLLYTADKKFFTDMSGHILKMHASATASTIMYGQIDTFTIMVSATLLEMLHPDQEGRKTQREALFAHNLEVVTGKELVHAMHETECRYVEVENHDYELYHKVFVDIMGREPMVYLLF